MARSLDMSMLLLTKKCHFVLWMINKSLLSPAGNKDDSIPTSPSMFLVSAFLFGRLICIQKYIFVILILIFPMSNDFGHLFICLLTLGHLCKLPSCILCSFFFFPHCGSCLFFGLKNIFDLNLFIYSLSLFFFFLPHRMAC